MHYAGCAKDFRPEDGLTASIINKELRYLTSISKDCSKSLISSSVLYEQYRGTWKVRRKFKMRIQI